MAANAADDQFEQRSAYRDPSADFVWMQSFHRRLPFTTKGRAMRTSKMFMLGAIISLLLLGLVLSRTAQAQTTTGTSGSATLGGASAIWLDDQGHSGSATTEVPTGGTPGQVMRCDGNDCTITAPKKARGTSGRTAGSQAKLGQHVVAGALHPTITPSHSTIIPPHPTPSH